MFNLLINLLPALVVICFAYNYKKLDISLGAGLVAACLIAQEFNIIDATRLLSYRLYSASFNYNYIPLFGFLIVIGILIQIIVESGVAPAAALNLTKRISTKKQAEYATVGLSSLLCIDDYLSALTTGTVMSLVTDHFSIPRWRIAYLVHSFSAPLVVLIPISSWLAMITTQIESSGISLTKIENLLVQCDPLWAYLASIPFIFYSLILLPSVIFVIKNQIMLPKSITPNTPPSPLNTTYQEQQQRAGYSDGLELVYPLLILLCATLLGLLWCGGYNMTTQTSIIEALKKCSHSSFVLFGAGCLATLISTLRLVGKGLLSPQKIQTCAYSGLKLMLPAIVMIVLSTSLSTVMSTDLLIGQHIVALLSGTRIINHIPLILFIISMGIAAIAGSSWATISLLMPLCLPIALALEGHVDPILLSQSTILLPTIGAIFSGSVCGDHISPMSETTIMSAISCGIDPATHAYTQIYFVFPAILGTSLSYLIWGILNSWNMTTRAITSLLLGLMACIFMLSLMHKKSNK